MAHLISKSKISQTDDIKLRKYELGDRVTGVRSGSICASGILVDAYVTLNGPKWGRIYRNPAYVVLCDDGRKRVYQALSK